MTPTENPRILLVEDDEDLVSAVAEYLTHHGFETHVAHTGDTALAEIERVRPALVVLDIMLPGMDGFQVCRKLRATNASLPVLMLTAKDEDFDRVLGLEIGADEYLVKPVQPRVLLAHIKAMLRRASLDTNSSQSQLTFGRLVINRATRDAMLDGQPLRFTAAEFDLLWLLATRAGHVTHRDYLLRELRGLAEAHDDRSVDARLYRLRKRFPEGIDVQRRIKSIRPHGYLFSVEPW
ncbi:MAG: response regulator transcription factor [Betaproteobacteria bacterium]|nr:response regulator transcription factor [Betaproteobacteria bacterium]